MNDSAARTVLPRVAEERTFRTHDGVDLFYRHWPATATPARGAILLFHRGHEHSGRMAHLVHGGGGKALRQKDLGGGFQQPQAGGNGFHD